MKQLAKFLLFFALSNVDGQHFMNQFKSVRHPVPLDASDPVILTTLIESGSLEEAKEAAKVNYIPFGDVEFYSGYLQVDKVFDNNLFFYFCPSEDDYENDPVVLWLQGGPGAPDGYGLFVEHGPFVINSDLDVEFREHRWTRNHSVLYIDSPVGTGFSFTNGDGYALNQTKVGEDLFEALQQFFTLFSELQDNDFFVIGESYGGKYVPAIGHTILRNNPNATLKINLKGLAVGNGLTDPVNQGNYGDYLYQLGFVDANTRDRLHELRELVVKYVKEENWTMASSCFDDQMQEVISVSTNMASPYNWYQMDSDEEEYWQSFIQQSEVRNAMHIGNTEFNSGSVFELLYEDIAKSVAPWVSELLDHYRYLIYNGQLDVMVAYPMTIDYVNNLNFSASEQYKLTERQIWRDTDGVVGYYKQAGNLTEVMVRNAGHMVPIEQPLRAYMMVYGFTRNQSFSQI